MRAGGSFSADKITSGNFAAHRSQFAEKLRICAVMLVPRANCSMNAEKSGSCRSANEAACREAKSFSQFSRLECAACREAVAVIRLAISCDICGAEKKQTNHWFVACEQNGELRIGGWNSRFCKKAGAQHLCGQTCLHKLVDEFMAKTIVEDRAAAEPGVVAEQLAAEPRASVHGIAAQGIADFRVIEERAAAPRNITAGASHTSSRAYPSHSNPLHPHPSHSNEDEFESSARLISAAEPTPDLLVAHEAEAARMVAVPVTAEQVPRYVSHQWRAGAWERERERGSYGEPGSRRH
jgi:hypothetical protein